MLHYDMYVIRQAGRQAVNPGRQSAMQVAISGPLHPTHLPSASGGADGPEHARHVAQVMPITVGGATGGGGGGG